MIQQKNISAYISSIAISILMILPATVLAQKKEIALPEMKKTPFLNGIEVSVDAVGPAMLAFGDYGQYESALRLNLRDKYFPIIELGIGKCDHKDDATDISYKTSAPYGRIGCDFNVLKNKHDIYRLYAGLRYAYTSYNYDAEHPGLEDPVWGDHVEYSIKDAKGSYHWAEVIFGVQAKIWGPIHLGWSARYRTRLAANEGEAGKSWYVPGYGKSNKSSISGTFNLIFVI